MTHRLRSLINEYNKVSASLANYIAAATEAHEEMNAIISEITYLSINKHRIIIGDTSIGSNLAISKDGNDIDLSNASVEVIDWLIGKIKNIEPTSEPDVMDVSDTWTIIVNHHNISDDFIESAIPHICGLVEEQLTHLARLCRSTKHKVTNKVIDDIAKLGFIDTGLETRELLSNIRKHCPIIDTYCEYH